MNSCSKPAGYVTDRALFASGSREAPLCRGSPLYATPTLMPARGSIRMQSSHGALVLSRRRSSDLSDVMQRAFNAWLELRASLSAFRACRTRNTENSGVLHVLSNRPVA